MGVFNFCSYPAAEFTSGHLLAPWWRDIKEALESAVVSAGSPDASFVCAGTALPSA